MKSVSFINLFLLLLSSASALYSASDDVTQLKVDSFDEFLSGSDVCIVKFYASWCVHCEEMAPKFKKAASILKGVVKFGAVNNQEEAKLGERFKVSAYPTILVFTKDRANPTKYSGARDEQSIVSYLLKEVQTLVKDRASKEGIKLESTSESYDDIDSGSCGGDGAYGSNDGFCGGGKESGKNQKQSRGSGSGKALIELTESNFDELVLKSTDEWLVEFFAPWCGHCKQLEPEWKKAAEELRGHVKVGAVDATVHQNLAQRYSIRGFPTIKRFPAGAKTGTPEDYAGGRTASDIISWALANAAKSRPPPEILELTNDARLRSACDEKQLCVIAFLPDLLDCQTKCRKGYLKVLKDVSAKHKQSDWGWLWSSASSHVNLEDALEVGGFGYPALVVVNVRKERAAVMRGSFSDKGVHEFLRDVSMGQPSIYLNPISKLPTLTSITAWDGKDAPSIQEEDDLGSKTEL